MCAPSSEARKATRLATVSGPRALSSAIWRITSFMSASFGRPAPPAVIGVLIEPGHTQFTRTPCLPYSTASARVKASTPPFDAP